MQEGDRRQFVVRLEKQEELVVLACNILGKRQGRQWAISL